MTWIEFRRVDLSVRASTWMGRVWDDGSHPHPRTLHTVSGMGLPMACSSRVEEFRLSSSAKSCNNSHPRRHLYMGFFVLLALGIYTFGTDVCNYLNQTKKSSVRKGKGRFTLVIIFSWRCRGISAIGKPRSSPHKRDWQRPILLKSWNGDGSGKHIDCMWLTSVWV